MTDIFVNYRHDDRLAAQVLKTGLPEAFDTFMDTVLGAGDSLDRNIMQALNESTLVLSVIGEGWKTSHNLQRLGEEHDWIRRELLTAFGQRSTTVIPVLFDVDMPSEAEIPQELWPLRDSVAARVRVNSLEMDLKALVQAIERVLGKRSSQAVSAEPMPADLPYLCDRVTQEDDLTQLVSAQRAGRSLVCVVHGHKWEDHEGFVNRLRQLRVLEDLFDAGKDGIDVYSLQWNKDLAKAGEHARALRTAMKSRVMKERGASDEQLSAYLRNAGRPAVMQLPITDSLLAECGATLLSDFQQAWNRIIAEMGAAPKHFLALWMNLTYEEPSGELPSGFDGPSLTKLGPVGGDDIYAWMNLDEVKRYIVRQETALSSLADDKSLWVTTQQPKIHMRQFVDAVLKVNEKSRREAG